MKNKALKYPTQIFKGNLVCAHWTYSSKKHNKIYIYNTDKELHKTDCGIFPFVTFTILMSGIFSITP